MNYKECVDVLTTLNPIRITDFSHDLIGVLESNLNKAKHTLNQNDDTRFTYNNNNVLDKFTNCNFNIFLRLKQIINLQNEDISLQHLTIIKTSMQNLVALTIGGNLQENLAGHINIPSETKENIILDKYNRLCSATERLFHLVQSDQLCSIILSSCLTPLITGYYQIMYCPIMKPQSVSTSVKSDTFVMTAEVYKKLTDDRGYFRDFGNILSTPKIKSHYVTASMLLMKRKTPVWFQRAVSMNLTSIMRDFGGIETIAVALLDSTIDYDANDTTKIWQILNVLVKLFLQFRTAPDFNTNICRQLLALLNVKDSQGNYIKPFEMIVAKCIKELYAVDPNVAIDELLKPVYDCLLGILIVPERGLLTGDVTDVVSQTTRVLHNCFADNNLDSADLPVLLLSPVVITLFKLHGSTVKCLPILNGLLKDLLLKYLLCDNMACKLYDAVLFDIGFPESSDVYLPRTDITVDIEDKSRVIIKTGRRNTNAIDDLRSLVEVDTKLKVDLFVYLIHCLCDRNKYFVVNSNDVSLHSKGMQNNLIVFELLTNLSEDKSVQQHINQHPASIVNYFEAFLDSCVKDKLHVGDTCETDAFQSFFTVVMIIQALSSSSGKNFLQTGRLLDLLRAISVEATSAELRQLVNGVISDVSSSDRDDGDVLVCDNPLAVSSVVDEAIAEVCDPLLPVRGHGLLRLTKLVEAGHPDVLKRKQYVLNVFQQNLKNDDSYIYLNAIGGLAALGELLPDIALPLIAEEYADFAQRAFDDQIELRLKLGEVLLRVTKNLGKRAYKHKALLLNTFLKTTKDDDHLIRASSLSNLGEVCRVLGDKVGPIITEVLDCVRRIIESDLAAEPRRAAISVLRQVLVGTERQMLDILSDQMPAIYRTIRAAYDNDPDEVTRLQAQLALEQLDENVRMIVFNQGSSVGSGGESGGDRGLEGDG